MPSIAMYIFHVRIEYAGYIGYFQLSVIRIADDRLNAYMFALYLLSI